MATDSDRVQALFHQAEGLSVAEREPLLAAACGDDTTLRRRIEALLKAHDATWNLLDHPLANTSSDVNERSAAVHPLSSGDAIGAYHLIRKLGEGGMGEVWEAAQDWPVRRRVALKLIKPGMDSAEVLRRFDTERQALALMDHTNIAKVFDAGTTPAGRPFFAMEFVDGIPVTKYCDEHRLSVRERLRLFATICAAIQHAHQKGIIHRDIKPSNILVAVCDGQPVPKVIDFGVAKATEQSFCERSRSTQYGTLIGTLEYMSPEQAELDATGADTRSDVYSLGVLMYEMLTGVTPLDPARFQVVGYDAALRLVREEEPPVPSTRLSRSHATLLAIATRRSAEPDKLPKLVRGELDWIVMKCLEKDRNRRYDSANALALDVLRYLNDDTVQAFPPSKWYRFGKFARRNRAGFVVASAIGFAALLALAALATSTIVISQEQQVTQKALKAETHAKGELQHALSRERVDGYFQRIALAHRELSADNLGRTLELLDECPEDLRGWEWRYLMRLSRVEPLVLRESADVNCLAFSRDGEQFASGGGDGAITIWNNKFERVSQILDAHRGATSSYVSSVAFHPNSKFLTSVGADKQVKVWDLGTHRQVFAARCDAIHEYGTAYAAAFSPDGRRLAAGSDGAVQVWDWEQNALVLGPLAGHAKKGITVAFSPDGRRLASGGWMGDILVWDAETGERLLALSKHSHPTTALAFSPDSKQLVSSNFDGRLIVWDAATGRTLRTLQANAGLAFCVAFSPDGLRLASAAEDKMVRIWDAATGREVLGLRGQTGHCGCVAYSPDGQRLASASKDGTIRIWDATSLSGNERQELQTFPQGSDEVWTLAISPDGQTVVSGGFSAPAKSAPAKIWNAQTGRVTALLPGHTHVVFCVAWQPDGRRIASAGVEGGLFTVMVWDADTGREAFTLPNALPGGPEYFAVAFSRDGKQLVTGQADGTVKVWDAQTGVLISRLDDHSRVVRAVVFSPNGRHLASASGDGLVKLWDATRLDEKQESLLTIQGRVPAQCLNVAFSADGRLATSGEENSVKIWDVQTGRELQSLRGHRGDVYTLAFSPDGRWIASAGQDSAVKVWDSRAGGAPVRSFRGHTALVSSVAFTPDGRRLFSGSRDHTVKVWDATVLKSALDAQERMASSFLK